MNAITTKINISAMSVMAEVEAMKAENMQRDHRGESMAYTDKDFYEKASELRVLSNDLHEAWRCGSAS